MTTYKQQRKKIQPSNTYYDDSYKNMYGVQWEM